MQTMRRQRGWAGLIVILIVLGIIAVLAKDALKSYGLMGGAAMEADPAWQGERTRLPAPIERARGVESTVQRQADEMRRRIEAQAR